MPKLIIEKELFLITMTQQISKLPPFLLEHLAVNRHTKARSILAQIQKEVAPRKARTLSWKPETKEEPTPHLEGTLRDFGITGTTLTRILTIYTENDILSAIAFVKHTGRHQTLKNPAGLVISALTHGWDIQKQSKRRKNEKLQPAADIEQSVDSIETLAENDLCKTLRQSLREEIGNSDYKSWFLRTSWHIDGTTLVIKTPSAFVHTQLSLHFQPFIQKLIRMVDDKITLHTFVLSQGS